MIIEVGKFYYYLDRYIWIFYGYLLYKLLNLNRVLDYGKCLDCFYKFFYKCFLDI